MCMDICMWTHTQHAHRQKEVFTRKLWCQDFILPYIQKQWLSKKPLMSHEWSTGPLAVLVFLGKWIQNRGLWLWCIHLVQEGKTKARKRSGAPQSQGWPSSQAPPPIFTWIAESQEGTEQGRGQSLLVVF